MQRSKLILATYLLALSGCEVSEKVGEGVDDATSDAVSGGQGATGGEGSTAGPTPTTSGPDATTSGPDEGSTGSILGSESGEPAGTSTSGDSESGSTTGAGGVVYGASVAATQDRTMLIYRADFGAGTCTRLRLETPASSMPPLDGITVPDYYNIYAAEISEEPETCSDLAVPMTYVEPGSGAGEITWDEEGPSACPLDVQIDVTLDYPAGDAWVPESEALDASIDVDGCP